jgi:uncharacterized protein (DUF1499 family)
MKRIILLSIFVLVLAFSVSADKLDYEDCVSVADWSGAGISADAGVQYNGTSCKYDKGGNNNAHRQINVGKNFEPYNITGVWRHDIGAGWVSIMIGNWTTDNDNVLAGRDGVEFISHDGDNKVYERQCGNLASFGGNQLTDDTWFNVTLALNTSSGSTTNSLVTLWINDNEELTNCDFTGSVPLNELTQFILAESGTEVNYVDDIRIYNRTEGGGGGGPGLNAPVVSAINCTSCDVPFGDNESPYTTSDTTPTFFFQTDVNANCRIGNVDQNYTALGDLRNCTSGEGTQAHTCSLTVPDELDSVQDYVYVGCINTANANESLLASATFEMNITDLSTNTSTAIDKGIQHSSIWPGATVYNNQQVYLRDLNNNQVLATVDRVAVFGNQRWIFNVGVDEEAQLGLFNITPAVYVLDLVNVSLGSIQTQVSGLINATKR